MILNRMDHHLLVTDMVIYLIHTDSNHRKKRKKGYQSLNQTLTYQFKYISSSEFYTKTSRFKMI